MSDKYIYFLNMMSLLGEVDPLNESQYGEELVHTIMLFMHRLRIKL